MGLEIERKFLVSGAFPQDGAARPLVQGYIAREGGRTVRVRYDGQDYKLTIKGATRGLARREFEWTIHAEEGEVLLNSLCDRRVEKVRHKIAQDDLTWEIDVFSGANDGLIVAEIELPAEDHPFDKPGWLGREVTRDQRFFNAALLDHPFCDWGVPYAQLLSQETLNA